MHSEFSINNNNKTNMSTNKTSPLFGDKEGDHVERVVSLLPFELSMPIMQQQFSTASLTWYKMGKGQTLEQVATSTRLRLTEMLKANPWLGGRIKTRNGAAAIVYTPAQSKQQADRLLSVLNSTDVRVSMDTPYAETSALLQRTVVPLTYFWLWNWDAPFFRVALVRDYKDAQRFALVTSLAHCVGDGKTYYDLHNMIAHKAPVVALNINRKHHLHNAMTKTMGGPAFFGCYSEPTIGMVVRVVWSVLMALFVGPPTVVKLFWINPDWIKEQKQTGLFANDPTSNYKPEFLSSNDVMASKFLRITGCDQALMTVNFRGKIQDCHEHDAGNYYNFNPLRPADFGSPVGVRQVVNQLKGGQRYPTTHPMTSMEHMFSVNRPISFFTNWADFARPVPLNECEQLLHMPLVPTHSLRMPARMFSFCYVYKPTKECDKLGVLVSATPNAMKELEATGMMGPELLKIKGV
jgi:hypothetical protein